MPNLLELPPLVQEAFDHRDEPVSAVKKLIKEQVYSNVVANTLLDNGPEEKLAKLAKIVELESFPILSFFEVSPPTSREWGVILKSWNGRYKNNPKIKKLLERWGESFSPASEIEPEQLGSYLSLDVLGKCKYYEWQLGTVGWIKAFRNAPVESHVLLAEKVPIIQLWLRFLNTGNPEDALSFDDVSKLVSEETVFRKYVKYVFSKNPNAEAEQKLTSTRKQICDKSQYNCKAILERMVILGELHPTFCIGSNFQYSVESVPHLVKYPEIIPRLLSNDDTFLETVKRVYPSPETLIMPKVSYHNEAAEIIATLMGLYSKWELYIGTWMLAFKDIGNSRNNNNSNCVLPARKELLESEKISISDKCTLLGEKWEKFQKVDRVKFLSVNVNLISMMSMHSNTSLHANILTDGILFGMEHLRQPDAHGSVHIQWFDLYVRKHHLQLDDILRGIMHFAYKGYIVKNLIVKYKLEKYAPIIRELTLSGK